MASAEPSVNKAQRQRQRQRKRNLIQFIEDETDNESQSEQTFMVFRQQGNVKQQIFI